MRYKSIFKLCGVFGSVVEEPYLVPASPGMMMMERADFCCIDSKLPGARPRDPTLHRYYLSHPSLHCAFKVRCSFFLTRALCHKSRAGIKSLNNVIEMEYNFYFQYRLHAARSKRAFQECYIYSKLLVVVVIRSYYF